ncbi:alpha-mannosidase [Bacteroidia bacterium]|nr:alpha-mannosidase [Bacteroidia bacterium]GHT26619.1 alpha-mannosidase [Bacteroidia bacterium]
MKKTWIGLLLVLCYAPLLLGQTQHKAYMVSNAHFDTQWLWTVQTSIDDYLYKTMVQNFWLMDKYPDYIFNFEGGVKYSWMKEYYPEEYKRLKQYVKSGQWNIAGSTWDATDPNMPSPESFFRNILLGQEFFKKEFGIKSNDIFLPDCFGFGYTLPTIAAHAGLIGFSTQKLQWRKFPFYGKEKIPFLIGLWEGLDGSRILSVPHAQSYVSKYEYKDISRDEELIKLTEKDPNHVVYHYYGVGDRGGSPTIPSVASIEKGIHGSGPVKIISARSGQLYDDFYPFDKHPELPLFKGELLMDVHATGCYTSQAAMKLFNRRNEQLADAAERASVVAELFGGINYPAEELRSAWQRFLWHQFHDDMTGTSIPDVYKFSWNDELISQTKFAETITMAVGAVSRTLDTRVSGTPVIVYNPIAQSRKDMVTATIDLDKTVQNVTVTGPNGKQIPSQIVARKDGKASIAFPVASAAVSFSVYNIKTGGSTLKSDLKVSANSLENKVYKLSLDKNGDIASIIDKRENKELVKKGNAFRLALFTKNESLSWPAWEIFKETLDAEPIAITDNVKITIAEQGPVRATLKIARIHGQSTFIQYISLTNGAADDRIDITNEIDWNEANSLLKAEFPMNVANEKATYDLGIGYIERGNNTQTAYEIYAQQWADITDTDKSYGVAVMNDCKYGWDKPDDNTLRLTLLHTPKVGKDPNMTHQDHLDWGHHTIRYAIVGHKSIATDGRVAGKTEAFNQPLLSFTTTKHKGSNGREYSFVKTNAPQIVVKAIKKAESGDGYVIRVNEISGNNLPKATITFAAPIEYAQELNGIEEPVGDIQYAGNTITFDAKGFQPRTFKVKFKEGNASIHTPQNQPVDITHNATAVTTDAFRRSGNFDGAGNSFAAELLPELVVSDGIAFQLKNKPDEYNYVRCEGQTITLPNHKGATKLYLLVTSSKEDRETTFIIDGKQQTFLIPYYSGFYGQWGWKGESEGYIKEGSIAHLGTHRHSEKAGNESYIYTYLYKIGIDIDSNAQTFTLPNDKNIALFAATLTDNPNEIRSAMEMRALPYKTVSK